MMQPLAVNYEISLPAQGPVLFTCEAQDLSQPLPSVPTLRGKWLMSPESACLCIEDAAFPMLLALDQVPLALMHQAQKRGALLVFLRPDSSSVKGYHVAAAYRIELQS